MKYLTVESFVRSLPEEDLWKIIEDYETMDMMMGFAMRDCNDSL